MTDDLMFKVDVARTSDGEVIVVAQGELERPAFMQLLMAAKGLGVMIEAGLCADIWINPKTGSIRLNAVPGRVAR